MSLFKDFKAGKIGVHELRELCKKPERKKKEVQIKLNFEVNNEKEN